MRKDRTKEFAEELRDGLLKAYSQVRPTKGDKYAYGVALDRLALFLRQLAARAQEAGDLQFHKDCAGCAGWVKDLSSQLLTLEVTGHTGPALQSTKNPGTTLWPSERQLRLYVTVGVKALIQRGVTRKNAAKQAKSKVSAIKDKPVNRILSWMDEFGKKNAWVDEHGEKQSDPVFQGLVKLGIDSEHWFQLANALRNPRLLSA
jgi:hypothetical protein